MSSFKLGPPPLQSRRRRQTTWDNSETLRCEDAPNNKPLLSKKAKGAPMFEDWVRISHFWEKETNGNHASIQSIPIDIDMKVWHCDHWQTLECFPTAVDLCVAPVLGTLGAERPKRKQPGKQQWYACRAFHAQNELPKGVNMQVMISWGRWSLSNFIIMKYDEIWWHIMKYYETWWNIMKYDEILWNIMKYSEILWNHHPIPQDSTSSFSSFSTLRIMLNHAGFLWCQSSSSPLGALSAWQLTRRRRFDGDDVTSLATRGRDSNAAVVPKFLWSCSWCLFVVNDYQ